MWFLAWRQLFSKKKQTFLIFLGVVFSTMIYVIIAGLQYGTRDYIAEQLLNNTAHIIIKGSEQRIDGADLRSRFYPEIDLVKWITPPVGKREESKLEYPQGWFNRLNEDPDVTGYAPRLSANAILVGSAARHTIGLVGILPERQMQVTSIGDYILEGSLLDLKVGTSHLAIGKELLNNLGARLGQTVNVTVGNNETRPFKIVAVFELGNKQIDETMAFAHLNDVQVLNRTPGRVTEISVSIRDMNASTDKAAEFSLYTKDKVEGWEQANASFLQVIKIQDIVRIVITGALLMVSAFGIYNVLSIMINQKQKEIAILQSIGYAPSKIRSLFLIQGVSLGIVGGLVGIAIGFGACLWIGSIDLGFKIGKGTTLLISYRTDIYLTALFASMGSSTLASLLPAWAASRMTPLDIIRANL